MTKSPRRLPNRWARGPGGQPDAHDCGATPRAGGRPRRAGGDRPAGPRGRTPRGAPSPTAAAEAPLVPDRGVAAPPLATPCTRMHLPRMHAYRATGDPRGPTRGQSRRPVPMPSTAPPNDPRPTRLVTIRMSRRRGALVGTCNGQRSDALYDSWFYLSGSRWRFWWCRSFALACPQVRKWAEC